MKTKVYITLVFLVLFSVFFAVSPLAAGDCFVDKTGAFDGVHAQIEQELDTLSKSTDYSFFIYAYANDDPEENIWGEDLFYELGFSYHTDTVLLTLKLERGEWFCDIYTYGRANETITDAEIDYLLEDGGIFDRIKTQNAQDGVRDYVDFVGRAVRRNAIPFVRRLWVPILWGLVGAFVAFLCVFIPYKRKVRSDCYPLQEFTKLNLTYSRDDFAGSFVSRRHVPRSSSGARGGGSRGGGRGGGGGHRGGR